MKRNVIYLLVTVSASLLGGCINSSEDCPAPTPSGDVAVNFRFSYDYNADSADRFATHVESVSLFVYNAETGGLVDSQQVPRTQMQNGNTLASELAEGGYVAVAFGNADKNHYDISGHEDMESLRLMLTHIEQDAVISNDYSHLFHGLSYFEVWKSEVAVPVRMVKNTNRVTITVRGLGEQYLDTDGCFNLTVSASHTGYDYHNRVAATGSVTHYPDLSTRGGDILASVQLLRLLEDDTGLRFRMTVKDPLTGKQAVFEENIIEAIASSEGASKWSDLQEYLDRHDEFGLIYVMDVDAQGNITLELWDVIDQPEELG